MNKKSIVVVERRAGPKEGQGVLHTMEACPERLALKSSDFDLVDADEVTLSVLKTKHLRCATCEQLEVAASTDRVRFLLANLATKQAS